MNHLRFLKFVKETRKSHIGILKFFISARGLTNLNLYNHYNKVRGSYNKDDYNNENMNKCNIIIN